MPLQVCSNRQFCSPSAAASVAVTCTGVAWTNSAWTEIAPTTDVVWALVSVVAWSTDSNVTSDDTEFDIGTGGSGSEVVIATVRRRNNQQDAVLIQQFRFMIPIDNLNGRHAVRVRASHTRAAVWNVAITYVKQPIVGTLLISRSPTLVYPPAANSITQSTSGTPWANVSYTTIVASTASDLVLTHAVLMLASAGARGEVDIAIGAAASEIVLATIRITSRSAFATAGAYYEFPNPIDAVPAGSRLSFRARCSIATVTAACALIYQVKPL